MEKNTDILNELKAISPFLAGISKTNVFKVPEGYFDGVSGLVLGRITNERDIATIEKLKVEQHQFVPEGYFDQLSSSILDKIKKQEQDSLPQRDESALSVELIGWNHHNPFTIPEHYFENLPELLLNRIKEITEQENLSPLLTSLKSVQPYHLPADYFEGLPSKILEGVKENSGAKVLVMPRRFKFLRYAAAAVFTGALALGLYQFGNKRITQNPDQASVAKLDSSILQGKEMDDNKFNETLNNLSADDIVNYLQVHNNEADIAVLSSSVEDNSLPSADDYLLDNQTLDNYLKTIDTKMNKE